jgi:ABC-type Mn2+/Zn2+ transport system ATPase subunit
MLTATDLSYGPPGSPLLHEGLAVDLRAGELLHVTGANGAGKSLLARVLLGLAPARSGQTKNTFAGHRYLPQMQNRSAHLPYTLGELVTYAGDWEKAEAIGLLPAAQAPRPWNRASGGERQRTLLTRFFLGAGDLLVLDEPFNHLDSASRDRVRALLGETLRADSARAALLISHDDAPASWLSGVPVRTLSLRSKGESA